MTVLSSDSRLLIFAPSARVGGPLEYLAQAVPGLTRAWGGPSWIAAPEASLPSTDVLPGSAHLVPLSGSDEAHGRPLELLRRHREARRLWAEIEPDVAFCLGGYTYFGPVRPSVVLFQNAARLRDLRHPSPRTTLYLASLRVLMLAAQLRCTASIAVSDYVSASLPIRRIGRDPIVIRHGVTIVGSQAATPIFSDSIVIPGAVLPYKGIEIAIRSLVGCRRSLRLDVIGPLLDRRYSGYLKGLSRALGVEERVAFRGRVTRQELLSRVAGARAVLIPSRAEACPNVLLEAAAIDPHRPIVVLKRPWNEEYSSLVDCRPPEAELARALEALPAASLPDVVARRTARLAGEHDWTSTVRRTADVLRGTLRS